MHFKCHENHPYKNFIEYINMTEAARFIEDYFDFVSYVEFDDSASVTTNKIILQYTDLKDIHSILANSDFLNLVIHRYINALQTLIMKNNVECTEVFVRLGEFRERIINYFSTFTPTDIFNLSSWFVTDTVDMDDITYYKDLLLMEIELADKAERSQKQRSTYFKRMCLQHSENNDEQKNQYKNTKDLSNITTTNPEDYHYIKSLIIPKIKPLSNLNGFLIEGNEHIEETPIYLNSPKFNDRIKNLLETKLEHHISKIGKNGYINKNRVYSSYGVTPNLTGSTNKTSEQVHKYDTKLKEIEKELRIDQIITISFLMYLKYFVDESDDSNEKEQHKRQSIQSLLHTTIISPNSQLTVPEDFLIQLGYEIQSYAEETVLSCNRQGTKDDDLIDLIALFLHYRFSLPTLNDYNNFLILMRRIENNVFRLATESADYSSFLDMNGLLFNIQCSYNNWIREININDKNADYGDKDKAMENRLFINDRHIQKINEGNFIKERFKKIIHS